MVKAFVGTLVALVLFVALLFGIGVVAGQGIPTVEVRGTPLLEEPAAEWPTTELTVVLRDVVANGQVWVLINHPRWGARFVLQADWDTIMVTPGAGAGTGTPTGGSGSATPGAPAATATSVPGVINPDIFDHIMYCDLRAGQAACDWTVGGVAESFSLHDDDGNWHIADSIAEAASLVSTYPYVNSYTMPTGASACTLVGGEKGQIESNVRSHANQFPVLATFTLTAPICH